MKTDILEKSDKPSKKIRIWIALALLGASLVTIALPQFILQLAEYQYQPGALRFIFSAISFKGQVIQYSLLLRWVEAGIYLFLLAGIGLTFWRKLLPAALAGCLSGALTIVSLLLISSMETTFKAAGVENPVATAQPAFYILLCLPFAAAVLLLWSRGGEMLARAIFQASAFISVAAVAMITLYMVIAGLPAIARIGPLQFLFGTIWKPTHATDPLFGILPMMLATLAGTFGAVIIGVPIGLLTAVFLAEIAPPWLVSLVRPAIELLAGIPSVIYGFFGLQILVPLVQKLFDLPTGATLFTAILILAIMILPTIVNTAENGLRAVPVIYKEASLAIGATHIETIFKVLIPAARSPILSGVILGVGRAIGETMAVIMVAGNMPNMPALFGAVRPLTVGIALEMSYASGLHQQALFAIGLILFAFIMLVNITFSWISKKGVQMDDSCK